MKKYLKIYLGILLAIACLMSEAQSEENGKIKVEISKEVDGEKRTFKGEYDSEEQMMADPNYQEFAGDDNRFHFFFDGEDDVSLHMDMMDNFQSHMFSFGDQDDPFFFKFNGDTVFNGTSFKNIHQFNLPAFDDDLKEKLDALGIDLDGLLGKLDDEESKSFSISDVQGNTFGKRGKISSNDRLSLTELDLYQVGSGKLKVKFTVPKEDQLEINIINTDGKEIFTRYFESFGGTYSETVDFSEQNEGEYLLEIKQGKKREIKKITIN